MKSVVFLILLISTSLLSAASFIGFLSELHGCFNFENLLIFSDGDYPLMESILRGASKAQWPVLIYSNPEKHEANLQRVLAKNSLSLVIAGGLEDPVLNRTNEILKGFRRNKVIFYFSLSGIDLERFCQWMWRNKFLNALAFTETGIYTFDIAPTVKLKNVTDLAIEEKFPNQVNRDLKGMTVDIQYKAPSEVSIYKNKVWPIFGKLVYSFMEHKQLTPMQDSLFSLGNFQDCIEDILSNSTEMCLNGPVLDSSVDSIDKSYPIYLLQYCLIHPVRNEIPRYLYIIMPFQRITMGVLFLEVIVIGLMLFIINVVSSHRAELGNSLLQSLLFSLALPSPIGQYKNLPVRRMFVFGLLLAFGLIIENFYSAKLSSYMTKKMHGRQIDTAEDLVKSKLEIRTYKPLIEELKRDFPHIFNKMHVEERRRYDLTEYDKGYITVDKQWIEIDKQQERLSKPLMRKSKLCFYHWDLGFSLAKDSYLTEDLNFFIILIRDHGLIQIWTEFSFWHGVGAGVYKMVPYTEEQVLVPLNLKFFAICWCVHVIGCLTSIFTFFAELIWKKVIITAKQFE